MARPADPELRMADQCLARAAALEVTPARPHASQARLGWVATAARCAGDAGIGTLRLMAALAP